MIYLEPGDRLPVVAALQARLNVHFGDIGRLRVGGDIGPRTRAAFTESMMRAVPGFQTAASAPRGRSS